MCVSNQMLWGALLTVRRMVMRPPASTPTRLTRAWPRKLVVCCSAEVAIFCPASKTRLMYCSSVDDWERPEPQIFIRRLSGARGDWWTRGKTRPPEPIGCRCCSGYCAPQRPMAGCQVVARIASPKSKAIWTIQLSKEAHASQS